MYNNWSNQRLSWFLWKLQWARAVEVLEKGEVGSDASFGMQQRPDGDLEIDDKFLQKENFNIPACQRCSGVLKPDVTCCLLFFHWFLLCLHLITSTFTSCMSSRFENCAAEFCALRSANWFCAGCLFRWQRSQSTGGFLFGNDPWSWFFVGGGFVTHDYVRFSPCQVYDIGGLWMLWACVKWLLLLYCVFPFSVLFIVKVSGCLTSLVCFFEVQFYGCNHCVRAALEKGAPVAIVNIGPTRADDIATLKIEAQSGEVVNLITNYMHLTFTGFIAWIDLPCFLNWFEG